jgi:hypothetical protein
VGIHDRSRRSAGTAFVRAPSFFGATVVARPSRTDRVDASHPNSNAQAQKIARRCSVGARGHLQSNFRERPHHERSLESPPLVAVDCTFRRKHRLFGHAVHPEWRHSRQPGPEHRDAVDGRTADTRTIRRVGFAGPATLGLTFAPWTAASDVRPRDAEVPRGVASPLLAPIVAGCLVPDRALSIEHSVRLGRPILSPTALDVASERGVPAPGRTPTNATNYFGAAPTQSPMNAGPTWDPSSEAAKDAELYPAVVPAGYRAEARPWWAPVSPWGVFDPWSEQATKGLQGLYNYFSRSPSYPGGGNPNGPGCKEEWEEARRDCADWVSSPNPRSWPTGGHLDIEDCARGLVSERCGGNPVEYPRPRRK